MSEKVRTVLHLDEDAARLLDTLASPRRKGDFIAGLIREAAKRQRGDWADLGILERIEAKVDRLLAQRGQPC